MVSGFHIGDFPQMFNDLYCPEWGFKILFVILVCVGGACQLWVSLCRGQGLGKFGHSQISICVSFLLVKFFSSEKSSSTQHSALGYIPVCQCSQINHRKGIMGFYYFICQISLNPFIFIITPHSCPQLISLLLSPELFWLKLFFLKLFYSCSITVVYIFSSPLPATPSKPTSLPCFHPPPWFCPCVLYSK